MKTIFDFDVIRKLIAGSESKAPFNIIIDSMNGGMHTYLNYRISLNIFFFFNYFLR